ncbi:hypothetical protein PINS_up023098 [Pythium insidiosum]|nr:hypothetical protein PINS_up023098 [Pythium insidiosum]
MEANATVTSRSPHARRLLRLSLPTLITFVSLIVLTAIVLGISRSAPAVVAAIALNDSLNELFRMTLRLEFQPSMGDGSIEAASLYLHNATEEYSLSRTTCCSGRTTGFKGEKGV